MNEKIKEIIDALAIATIENNEGVEFSPDVCEKLYEYITNLQEEIEKLNNKIKEQSLLLIEFQDMEQRLKKKDIIIDDLVYKCEDLDNCKKGYEKAIIKYGDYKSRCEKANEYIKENKDKYYHDWGEDDGSYDTYLDETEIDKLSNILNGGNNENN